MRCFVAIPVSRAWREALRSVRSAAIERRARGVRWVHPEHYHITLRFIGEFEERRLPDLMAALGRISATIAPFTLHLADLGGFPSRGMPRVLCAGIHDPEGGCQRWLTAAEPEFDALGIEHESRPWRGHVTLARSRSRPAAAVLDAIARSAEGLAPLTLPVAHVTLFESVRTPHGPRYTVLGKFALGG